MQSMLNEQQSEVVLDRLIWAADHLRNEDPFAGLSSSRIELVPEGAKVSMALYHPNGHTISSEYVCGFLEIATARDNILASLMAQMYDALIDKYRETSVDENVLGRKG